MRQSSVLRRDVLKVVLATCVGLTFAPLSLWAIGLTRSVMPVGGGCKVTLAWDFCGKVGSNLFVEERFSPGCAVDQATVPFDALDASWFSDGVVRFSVKQSRLEQAGSISFTILTGATAGSVVGDWKLYLDGMLCKGGVAGRAVLTSLSGTATTGGESGSVDPNLVETAVAITSFKLVGGTSELAYSNLSQAGLLVVEGCEGLGKTWREIKRVTVVAGSGAVQLTETEVGACRFMRMKLLTKGE